MEQGLGCGVGAAAHRSDTEAGGDLNGPADGFTKIHRFGFEGCPKAFGVSGGGFGVAAGQNHDELLAAVAAHGVIGSDVGLHAAGGLFENGVAGQMTKTVVDGLELVQVADHHRHGRFLAFGAAEFAGEHLKNGSAVEKVRERVVRGLFAQGLAGGHKFGLKVDHTAPGAKAHLEFGGVEGLCEIVVGAGVHALDEVVFEALRGEQDDVDIPVTADLPDVLADFGAGETGHHPVQNGQLRGIVAFEDVPGLSAVGRGDGFVAPLLERDLQEAA